MDDSNALTKRRYHIKPVEGVFLVVDAAGERISTCPTEEAARQEIADCERDDMLFYDARAFVEAAVENMMKKHGLDRQAAKRWVTDAAEVV